jgi:hypothetical protein
VADALVSCGGPRTGPRTSHEKICAVGVRQDGNGSSEGDSRDHRGTQPAMKSTSLLLALLPALVTTVTAQTPDHLVGITRNLPALRHVSHAPCALLNQCPLPLPNSAALPPFVGGTAWNPVRPGAFVSNGIFIAQVDDNCALMCPPAPIPTLGPNAFVTGLEYVEGLGELWMIDSQGFLHRYANACPPAPLGVCNTGLAQTAIGNVTTGLAVDELNGLVFISYAQFPGGPTRIVVSQLANPCVPTSQFLAPPCLAGAAAPLLGLACDWGNQILYGTDGLGTIAMNYILAGPNVVLTGFTCCPGPAIGGDPMIGLAVRPGRATPTGQSCANGPCPPCPQIHTLRNDPNLGNAQFTLGLDQAPPLSFAWAMIGTGPCLPVGPVIPPLCGPIYTLPLLGSIGPVVTGGGGGPCDGTASFNLPLPVGAGLAGQVFSSQCLTLCFGGGVFGTGLSNCLSWELQGN